MYIGIQFFPFNPLIWPVGWFIGTPWLLYAAGMYLCVMSMACYKYYHLVNKLCIDTLHNLPAALNRARQGALLYPKAGIFLRNMHISRSASQNSP